MRSEGYGYRVCVCVCVCLSVWSVPANLQSQATRRRNSDINGLSVRGHCFKWGVFLKTALFYKDRAIFVYRGEVRHFCVQLYACVNFLRATLRIRFVRIFMSRP